MTFSNWVEYRDANITTLKMLNEEDLANCAQILRKTALDKKTLWVLGNGGSASLASHAVADFSKTSSETRGFALKALAPHEWTSLQSAIGNDIDFEVGLAHTLEMYANEGDTILIFSVSGQSPNLLRTLEVSKRKKLNTIAVTGVRGRNLEEKVDCLMVIESDDYQVVENSQLVLMHFLSVY